MDTVRAHRDKTITTKTSNQTIEKYFQLIHPDDVSEKKLITRATCSIHQHTNYNWMVVFFTFVTTIQQKAYRQHKCLDLDWLQIISSQEVHDLTNARKRISSNSDQKKREKKLHNVSRLSITNHGCAPLASSNRSWSSQSNGQAIVGKRSDHAIAAGGHNDRAPRCGYQGKAVAQLRAAFRLCCRRQLLFRPCCRSLAAVHERPWPRGLALPMLAQNGCARGFLSQAGRLRVPILEHSWPWYCGSHIFGEEQLTWMNWFCISRIREVPNIDIGIFAGRYKISAVWC